MGDRVAVLKDGLLQQCASPRELFTRPANLFVAGFIGSPAMNLIEGMVAQGGFTALDGTIWPMPPRPIPDGPAIYGIRPEHFSLDGAGMPARVVVVEPMGSETQVMMRVGETQVNGVFRERIAARPGEVLPVTPQAAYVHLFSKETGQRL